MRRGFTPGHNASLRNDPQLRRPTNYFTYFALGLHVMYSVFRVELSRYILT